MYNQWYEKIENPQITTRINIFDYVRTFIRELENKEGKSIHFNNEIDAERVKGLMNCTKNTLFKSLTDLRTGHPYWNRQDVDYVKSNLGAGRGVVFYFLCLRCDRRVKYLYVYRELEPPLCRICCQIPYKPATYQQRKKSKLDRFLNK